MFPYIALRKYRNTPKNSGNITKKQKNAENSVLGKAAYTPKTALPTSHAQRGIKSPAKSTKQQATACGQKLLSAALAVLFTAEFPGIYITPANITFSVIITKQNAIFNNGKNY